jgi:NADH-quinone oxidoreductase subunit E
MPLSDPERHDIDAVLDHYPDRRSAAATVMRIVQEHRLWLSDATLADIGGYLGLSVEELDRVATFANMLFRRPVGRHVILVCNSFACWSLGYEPLWRAVRDALDVEMGGTTPDGRFTLLPIVCLGACDRGPAMVIDADLHGPVSAEDVPAILERYP